MKKVLITGANSYIGMSFERWVKERYPEEFQVDTVDMIGDAWKDKSFEGYDAVFHVAGIAHADVGNVADETKALYYKVNCDLAIETARKSKREGVDQFILMSSMIIYGESSGLGEKKIITETTIPHPTNFYGDSKWQADRKVRKLQDKNFHVAVIRPPMIYGKDSKGNYPLLSKFAKLLPIFPDIKNERSMLHIDNLCEFLVLLIRSGEDGIYFPQNKEYVRTSNLVKEIAKVTGHKIKITKVFNPFIWLTGKVPGKISGLVNKAFGNMVYEKGMSQCFGGKYQIRTLKESIEKTEKAQKKILILVNHEVVIYNFRKELVKCLLKEGYDVIISCPNGDRIPFLCDMGCKHIEVNFDRHGKNPFEELKLVMYYIKLVGKINPGYIFSYTIKPNLYGALAAALHRIPIIVNITGLGSAVRNPGILQKLMIIMYKIAFRKVQTIFVQNKENQKFFTDNRIYTDKLKLIPGSGVNLEEFGYSEYPSGDIVKFAFVSRVMKEKGIDEYLQMAKEMKEKYKDKIEFHICGFCEEDYEKILRKYEEENVIIYHGMIRDMRKFYQSINCIIHPSYHEGMANVILEAAASGRPSIVSDIAGCKEAVAHGETGYCVKVKQVKEFEKYIEKFLSHSNSQQKEMGEKAREKMKKEFDRQFIIDAYMKIINKMEEK